MPRFTLVRFDDWQALYDGDAKVDETHRLDVADVLRTVGADCAVKAASDAWDAEVAESGCVPDSLREFPEDAFS